MANARLCRLISALGQANYILTQLENWLAPPHMRNMEQSMDRRSQDLITADTSIILSTERGRMVGKVELSAKREKRI